MAIGEEFTSSNYNPWSIRIGLLGKSKLGFVYGRFSKSKFEPELHDQWEKVNVVVLSLIINVVKPGLLSSVVYASNAHKAWEDLNERFDKDTTLMGLNESYSQSRSQIMMMSPIFSINKAYSLLIDQESQRGLANFTQTNHTTEGIEGVVFYSNKNSTSAGGNFKFRKNQVRCDYYHYKGHTKENYYKLHGYPLDFKGKKKGQSSGVYTNNVSGSVFPNAAETGNQQGSYGTQIGIQQVQHSYMPQFSQITPNNSPPTPFFTKE
uniref:Uncharacterized protein LOC104231719 n=1 Tax=Nicotiana sylvestris TaxID=4096 RepID=A0A1U7WT14_NICSY|nr:PREDICTED: uncharacterized protein LOC104231719 [Nicotiana sylvestris]